MPTKSRRENIFIERFLSAYENYSWADASVDWLDERMDGAVEVLATRRSDGRTLAIEHTIIEPFVGDKQDHAFFADAFLRIEEDKSLVAPGRWIQLFIPVGTLYGQRKKATRDALVQAVHKWLKINRFSIPDSFSEHRCPTTGIPDYPVSEIAVYTKAFSLPGPGKLNVRRQQIGDNLGEVVEKALSKKLPKLVQTNADRRLLFLERQHMNLHPKRMLEEIQNRKPTFPALASVDEIWVLETMFYESEGYLRFERFENGTLIGSLDFSGENLLDKFENGTTILESANALNS